jgi:hypothetical protein
MSEAIAHKLKMKKREKRLRRKSLKGKKWLR